MANHYYDHGPPQGWQRYPSTWPGEVSPIRRLHLMSRRGLPVGPGTRWLGGVTNLTAYRMWCDGLVLVSMNENKDIVHIYPRQLSFTFI